MSRQLTLAEHFEAVPEAQERPSLTRPGSRPLTILEVNTIIKGLLEKDAQLSELTIEAEISNLVRAASGHAYFTLKDEKSTLKAVMWAGNARKIKAVFNNGSKVVVKGSISVYEPRGEYQLVVTELKLSGLGALYEAFERLKIKLQEEGLFDPSRKIPLPFLPRGIGVVTSPKGAVIQDIYRVVRRRFPNMPIYLVPVKVQGDGAVGEIVAGIRRLDADPRVDVLIIGRGGGSLEDLWAFNEEVLARAIAAAVKPLVSAVGHETDTTIADFVADRRASTPSQAGELVVPVKEDLERQIREQAQRLRRALQHRVDLTKQRLAKALACRFLSRPSLLVSERRLVLANRTRDLESLHQQFFRRARHAHELLVSRLHLLNPRALLERGYVLTTNAAGQVVTSITGLSVDQTVTLHLRDGRAETRVMRTEALKKEKENV